MAGFGLSWPTAERQQHGHHGRARQKRDENPEKHAGQSSNDGDLVTPNFGSNEI
jgi:hypothetical protein